MIYSRRARVLSERTTLEEEGSTSKQYTQLRKLKAYGTVPAPNRLRAREMLGGQQGHRTFAEGTIPAYWRMA